MLKFGFGGVGFGVQGQVSRVEGLQGYLAHKKHPLRRPPTVGLYLGSYDGPEGGGLFLMSEVPLYAPLFSVSPTRCRRRGIPIGTWVRDLWLRVCVSGLGFRV